MSGLCIGGMCIKLDTSGLWAPEDIRGKYLGFWDNRPPDFSLKAEDNQGLENGSYPEEARGVQHIRFVGDRIYLEGYDVYGELNLASAKGLLRISPNLNSLDCSLKAIFTVLLPQYAACMLHAAGLRRGGAGWLVCGPSGSGKSSVSRSLRDGEVLADELICVMRCGDKFYIMGTPFLGEVKPHPDLFGTRVSLRRLVILGSGKYGPLGAKETFWGLLQNIFYPAHGNPASYEAILDLAWGMAQEVTGVGLLFNWGADHWGLLDGMG
jgi:hypothetical protein